MKTVKPLSHNGASEWLVLSAVAVAASRQAEIPGWITGMTDKIRNHQADGLHFRNLNPSNKAMVCRDMAALPARYFVIESNKKICRGMRTLTHPKFLRKIGSTAG